MMAQGRSTRELFLPSCCLSKNGLPAWRFRPHSPLLLCPQSKGKDKGQSRRSGCPAQIPLAREAVPQSHLPLLQRNAPRLRSAEQGRLCPLNPTSPAAGDPPTLYRGRTASPLAVRGTSSGVPLTAQLPVGSARSSSLATATLLLSQPSPYPILLPSPAFPESRLPMNHRTRMPLRLFF